MKSIKKGDKFLCTEDINNVLGLPLFKKGEVYEVLYVDNEQVKTFITLNHNLYANEYTEWELEWIVKRFKQL